MKEEINKAIEEVLVEVEEKVGETVLVTYQVNPDFVPKQPNPKTPCKCGCQECVDSTPSGGFVPEDGFQGIHPRLEKTLRPKNKKLTEADTK